MSHKPEHCPAVAPYLLVDDAASLKAGATVQQEPAQKDGDSDKRGGFLGPCGNSWWIATQMEP